MATLWFCDRCGKQVPKDSYGAGKYGIQVPFNEDTLTGDYIQGKRFMKFCDQCAMELEDFLDDEFRKINNLQVTGKIKGISE